MKNKNQLSLVQKITKRQKFVVVSLILTILLLLIQLLPIKLRYQMIVIFGLSTFFLSVFALWGDLKGIEWLTLFILPTTFSTGVALFYFLLPVRWLTRLPIAILYGISIYAILLSENIFNVATIRTIQLHQAALAVSSFLTILTFFLFSNIIFSFHLSSLLNFIFFFTISFLGFLVNLWIISLEPYLEKKLIKVTLCLSVIIAEIVLILSFWPAVSLTNSLFLTTLFYLYLGITQTHLSQKPLGNLFWEYNLFLFTFLVLLFRSHWG